MENARLVFFEFILFAGGEVFKTTQSIISRDFKMMLSLFTQKVTVSPGCSLILDSNCTDAVFRFFRITRSSTSCHVEKSSQ